MLIETMHLTPGPAHEQTFLKTMMRYELTLLSKQLKCPVEVEAEASQWELRLKKTWLSNYAQLNTVMHTCKNTGAEGSDY